MSRDMCPHAIDRRMGFCADCATAEELREHLQRVQETNESSDRALFGTIKQQREEIDRLRDLIKKAEKSDHGDGFQHKCPWCGSVLGGALPECVPEQHQHDCPAFTPDGEVK